MHVVCVCVCVQSRKDLIQPFNEGETRVLVCTDLASRGIHHDKVKFNSCNSVL